MLFRSNRDRAGGRLLDVITLKYEKSRWGLSGTLTYHYAAGKMLRVAACAAGKSVTERLVTLLRENPGVLTDEFVTLAQENRLKREAAREFLKRGESDDTIRVEVQGRSRRHFWRAAVAERGS